MNMREVMRQARSAGIQHIDVWLYSYGGLTWFGTWYVGQRTLHKVIDPFAPDSIGQTWGQWWREYAQVNGYRHHTDIAKWEKHNG